MPTKCHACQIQLQIDPCQNTSSLVAAQGEHLWIIRASSIEVVSGSISMSIKETIAVNVPWITDYLLNTPRSSRLSSQEYRSGKCPYLAMHLHVTLVMQAYPTQFLREMLRSPASLHLGKSDYMLILVCVKIHMGPGRSLLTRMGMQNTSGSTPQGLAWLPTTIHFRIMTSNETRAQLQSRIPLRPANPSPLGPYLRIPYVLHNLLKHSSLNLHQPHHSI